MDAYEYGYRFGCLVQGKESKNSQAGTAKGARKLVKCLVCGEIFDSSWIPVLYAASAGSILWRWTQRIRTFAAIRRTFS